MVTYRIPNRHGYSIKFSPFCPGKIAVATSQPYGSTGSGILFILQLTSDGQFNQVSTSEWTDGLFDVAWSKIDANLLISASGDGTLQLWNLSNPKNPLQVFQEHSKEIYSIDWNHFHTEHVISSSWDSTIKLWDLSNKSSIGTFKGHETLVYSAAWSPLIPSCFASVSGDGVLKIWNSAVNNRAPLTIYTHDAEVLTCSWCKFNENILATGASDGIIRGWDMRHYSGPLFEQKGCKYAVRKIQFSPHYPSVLASVSYDFTTRIWDYKKSCDALEVIAHHSDFAYGLDFNINYQNQMADCGWDSLVHVYSPKSLENIYK